MSVCTKMVWTSTFPGCSLKLWTLSRTGKLKSSSYNRTPHHTAPTPNPEFIAHPIVTIYISRWRLYKSSCHAVQTISEVSGLIPVSNQFITSQDSPIQIILRRSINVGHWIVWKSTLLVAGINIVFYQCQIVSHKQQINWRSSPVSSWLFILHNSDLLHEC